LLVDLHLWNDFQTGQRARMQHRESPPPALRRAVVISPNVRMLEELQPLLAAHLPAAETNQLRNYPSPRDLSGAIGGSASYLIFLDVSSDRDQANQLLGEMARFGSGVQVLALLSGNDPDLILRCLRSGAIDFLIQPFTPDQFESALAKVARLQPSS